ncbi:hypothetical protein IV203_014829 [Nitzschia inconspicua]|uniref:Uncharacterized protein n=1 Tax=Nitzschia inconspicua TaxID=303405 RepID=A0A9K3PSP3_9STRA|nr:hypothetical protein IV203_014829 [Nitzschia inconspicua]
MFSGPLTPARNTSSQWIDLNWNTKPVSLWGTSRIPAAWSSNSHISALRDRGEIASLEIAEEPRRRRGIYTVYCLQQARSVQTMQVQQIVCQYAFVLSAVGLVFGVWSRDLEGQMDGGQT